MVALPNGPVCRIRLPILVSNGIRQPRHVQPRKLNIAMRRGDTRQIQDSHRSACIRYKRTKPVNFPLIRSAISAQILPFDSPASTPSSAPSTAALIAGDGRQ